MAFHNTNFTMVPLVVGTYTTGQLGNNITASTVHEIYCVTSGSITINAFGGGTATLAMTAGQNIKVMVGSCTVVSGSFLGFKTQFSASGGSPIQWNNS